jgi:hypothetical protein
MIYIVNYIITSFLKVPESVTVTVMEFYFQSTGHESNRIGNDE